VNKEDREDIITGLGKLQSWCHNYAVRKGFWEGDPHPAIKIALIHSEVSEALEAMRTEQKMDEHCPGYLNISIELADTIIRILDLAGALGVSLASAVVAKMDFNEMRPYKHGKAF